MPFNWKSPLGYLVAYSIEFTSAFFLLRVFACTLGFFTASCEILIGFAEDIKQQIHGLNQINDIRKAQAEFLEKFHEFIQLDSSAKQFSANYWIRRWRSKVYKILTWFLIIFRLTQKLSNIYQLIITAYFVWSILTICSTLLMVQMSLVEYFITLFSVNIFMDKFSKPMFDLVPA